MSTDAGPISWICRDMMRDRGDTIMSGQPGTRGQVPLRTAGNRILNPVNGRRVLGKDGSRMLETASTIGMSMEQVIELG